ncbi:MAG: hypothetical protein K5829_12810 [Treponema sp.]|nr:hypothetical protein [Treponema sp.]
MKKNLFSFLLLSIALLFTFGCKKESEENEDSEKILTIPEEDEYSVTLDDIIIEKTIAISDSFQKIVFTYPTQNLDGQTIRASAIMCIPASVYKSETKEILDFMIINSHGASSSNSEAPSIAEGADYLPILIGQKNAIGVEADYIGFGESAEQLQAFAFGDLNARTSLHAFICARMWLQSQGYTWEDKVANVGFSQGGQTAMHIQRLVDTCEAYEEVKITKTFAGGGCYDLATTINYSLDNYSLPVLPAVIWLGIVSFNRLANLGFEENKIFKDTSIVEQLISKEKALINYGIFQPWSDSLSSDMLDSSSKLRKRITNKIKTYNCYFIPKSTSKIVLFSDSDDDVVPTKNSDELYTFFNENGFTMEKIEKDKDADFSRDNIYIKFNTKETLDSTSLASGLLPALSLPEGISLASLTPSHFTAGTVFYTKVVEELASSNW